MITDIHSAHQELADLCGALGNPIRLRMLRILAERERLCGDIVDMFHLSQSTVSHHLKRLKDSGLVEFEERGTSTCYRINQDRLLDLKRLVAELIS